MIDQQEIGVLYRQ